MSEREQTPARRMGMDGSKWATEFHKTARQLGYSDMDEGWLIVWFANAIMAGYDEGQRHAAARLLREPAERDARISAWQAVYDQCVDSGMEVGEDETGQDAVLRFVSHDPIAEPTARYCDMCNGELDRRQAPPKVPEFLEKMHRKGIAVAAARLSLMQRVQEFVAAGSTLDKIEPLRIALDEFDRVSALKISSLREPAATDELQCGHVSFDGSVCPKRLCHFGEHGYPEPAEPTPEDGPREASKLEGVCSCGYVRRICGCCPGCQFCRCELNATPNRIPPTSDPERVERRYPGPEGDYVSTRSAPTPSDGEPRARLVAGWSEPRERMIVCELCGNKRCPHASDHRNPCTGSNEPDQPGSAFGGLTAPAESREERQKVVGIHVPSHTATTTVRPTPRDGDEGRERARMRENEGRPIAGIGERAGRLRTATYHMDEPWALQRLGVELPHFLDLVNAALAPPHAQPVEEPVALYADEGEMQRMATGARRQRQSTLAVVQPDREALKRALRALYVEGVQGGVEHSVDAAAQAGCAATAEIIAGARDDAKKEAADFFDMEWPAVGERCDWPALADVLALIDGAPEL